MFSKTPDFWSRIKTLERVFLILMLLSLAVDFFFNKGLPIDILVACLLLSICYFPFGFYFLGKPADNRNIIPSIIFGFAYMLGFIILMMGALKVEGYQYPLFVIFFLLVIILIFLGFKLRSGAYAKAYLYAQFFRIGVIFIVNLIVLLHGLLY